MSDTLADLSTGLPPEFLAGDHHLKTPFINTHNSSQQRLKILHPPEKKRVFSGSPESSFYWNVSSPATPFVQENEDPWRLIYAAAEQVARMKMNAVNNAGFGNENRHQCVSNDGFVRLQQLRRRLAGGRGNYDGVGRCATGGPVIWPPTPVDNQHRQQHSNGFVVVKPVVAGSSGGCGRRIGVVKKESAGTGVFLPRSYCNGPPESKKKPTCLPTHIPFNENLDSIHGGFAPPQYRKRDELAELVMARRNAVMVAQRRINAVHVGAPETRNGPPEIVLPQEWTY